MRSADIRVRYRAGMGSLLFSGPGEGGTVMDMAVAGERKFGGFEDGDALLKGSVVNDWKGKCLLFCCEDGRL